MTFECQVEGDGNPKEYKFVWTRAGDGGFREETDDGQLDLSVTSLDKEDIYYCTPVNEVGPGDPAKITLIVNSE